MRRGRRVGRLRGQQHAQHVGKYRVAPRDAPGRAWSREPQHRRGERRLRCAVRVERWRAHKAVDERTRERRQALLHMGIVACGGGRALCCGAPGDGVMFTALKELAPRLLKSKLS